MSQVGVGLDQESWSSLQVSHVSDGNSDLNHHLLFPNTWEVGLEAEQLGIELVLEYGSQAVVKPLSYSTCPYLRILNCKFLADSSREGIC